MASLDGSTAFATASLSILLPEQPLDISLFTFSRPPHHKQIRRCIQGLLQRVRLLAERTFQIADEIQPPVDEFRLGILFMIRFGWLLFVPSDFPTGHRSVPPWGDR
mgnify:CR=1 FL=1